MMNEVKQGILVSETCGRYVQKDRLLLHGFEAQEDE
jgi:hypothetical protein